MKKLALALIVLLIAAPSALATEHRVRKGDTLGSIARRYKCSLVELRQANKLRGDRIKAGQKLTIPDTCDAVPDAPPDVTPTAASAKKAQTITHEVLADETLADIASRYDTTVAAIEAKNKAVLKKGLRPGIKLKIVTTADERAQKRVSYTIEAGDTLGRIARKFHVTVRDLQRMNPGKDPDRLRVGQKIWIYGEGRPGRSQAVGKPQHGSLLNGEQLLDGPGWSLRNPAHAWGTNETIRYLKAAFAEVKKKEPQAHEICVGDISVKTGGFLAPHKSHQSGRDADIGYIFSKVTPGKPCVFMGANVGLDLPAMWALIQAIAGPNEAASKVEYIFLGYDVQKKVYDYAKAQGASDSKLAWLFQYPRGSAAMRGLIRHEPSHENHLHVRFECPNGDPDCI